MQKDRFEIVPFPNLEQFTADPGDARPLRVCIATEEIFGPVRNGGIASTYYHLARTLAADGHEVTVLYLKGDRCENETAEHWIEFYAALKITFVPLEQEDTPLEGAALNWQGRYYAFYRWLKDQQPFDVVHTSEWRGGAYYVLQAKRQGLAFRDTLFLVKSSSPWIWNRHYTMRTVESVDQLVCMYAERRTVELADLVIGGSAHLLRFMQQKGYRLPAGRTFVQPNIIDLQELSGGDGRPSYAFGDKVASRELVFFGRLEGRKGLEIFSDALDRLLQQGVQPDSVTFLGKEGRNLPAYPHLSSLQYIEKKQKEWPFPVTVIADYDQDKAIGYLCEKPRIAVMPSIIENSTMTVYECLVHRIPFVATRVGGTPELIAPEYHGDTLVEPHPEDLAAALGRVLETGGTVAEGAFDYDNNLKTWRGFHSYLGRELSKRNVSEVLADFTAASGEGEAFLAEGAGARPKVSVCIYHHRRPAYLEALLDSLATQEEAPDEVIVVTDGPLSAQGRTQLGALRRRFGERGWRFLETPHRCIGAAWTRAAQEASGDLLLFLHAERHLARPALVGTLAAAAAASPAAAFSWVVDRFASEAPRPAAATVPAARVLPVGGDLASGFYLSGVYAAGCFAVRRAALLALGGFAEAYHLAGVEQELLARLQLNGEELEVVPEALCWERQAKPNVAFNFSGGDYLEIRPFLERSPIYLESIMLLARQQQASVDRIKADLVGARMMNNRLREELARLADAERRRGEFLGAAGPSPAGASSEGDESPPTVEPSPFQPGDEAAQGETADRPGGSGGPQ